MSGPWLAFAGGYIVGVLTMTSAYWGLHHRSAPCDWDGESYCMDCPPSRIRPATHERVTGMTHEDLTTDMLCCFCAQEARRG